MLAGGSSPIECEVVDLRTVVPLDTETVIESGEY
jgi:pyruvate/2-oxoglutarate/acetoin dehydrogenase E1 component